MNPKHGWLNRQYLAQKVKMNDIVAQVRESLVFLADEKTRQSGQRFFKGGIKSYGVKLPIVNQIAKESFPLLKGSSKPEVFRLCEQLWASGYFEESIVACHFAFRYKKDFTLDDFDIFERWIEQFVDNWASCDTFCNHTVGYLVEKFPVLVDRLKVWTTSDNRWLRRASAVSLIVPAKKGLFLNEILEIATRLMTDSDDMVQKGYGWMLKVTASKHLMDVFDFVMENRKSMPRTALRYAIEKMPEDLKSQAMQK